MSPENALVLVVENNPKNQERIGKSLAEAGHHVVVQATTMDEAKEIIPKLERLRVQVVVVDGNISGSDYNGTDGINIARQIRKEAPSVKIVGHFLNPAGVKWFDANVWKIRERLKPGSLARKISEL